MEQYKELHEKLVNKTITENELKLLIHLTCDSVTAYRNYYISESELPL